MMTPKEKAASVRKADRYKIANCPYCLKTKCIVVPLECLHEYCTTCTINLIKITKIKKGLQYFNKYGEDAIKCNQCGILNIVDDLM